MASYYLAAFLGVLATASGQLLFKHGAIRSTGASPVRLYLNPACMSAYVLMLLATVLNLYCYQGLPLKMATVIGPCNYILVGLGSWLLLRERLTRSQILGAFIVVAGIIVFNLGVAR